MRSPSSWLPDDFFAVRTRVEARTVSAIVATAFVLVVVSSAVAWDGTVPAWEAAPLRWIVGWPDHLEPIMWVIQQVGVLMAPVIVGAIVAWRTRRAWHLLPFVLILPLKLSIEKAIIKQLVDRDRPFTSLGPDIEVRGPQLAGLSFPSGHATTATATAVLLVAFLPRTWRPIPIVWAFGVSVARLYYGEHNVLDVAAGTALGLAFAVVLWFSLLNREVEAPPQQGAG
ncbi:MAG: phosphatase PAP2 family protein [Actinomycetota bacterium]